MVLSARKLPSAPYHPRPERWPQVTLKGCFVLVTLAGVFLGWLGFQIKWMRDRHKALESGSVQRHNFMGFYPTPYPPSLLRAFGERSIWAFDLKVAASATDDELHRIRALFPEFSVDREEPPPAP